VKRALIRCDGAVAPPSLRSEKWDVQKALYHRGPNANVTLKIQSPSATLLKSVGGHEGDLIRIASYIYAADQNVSRGGEADVTDKSWERAMVLCIPVSDPDFWSQDDVARRLRDVLRFVSGDRWQFHFLPMIAENEQLTFDLDPGATALGQPDAVFLFSGGIDSLSAVVQSVSELGRRPLLVAHSPAYNIKSRQTRLAQSLGTHFPNWHFPAFRMAIHRAGGDASDYAQRSRSFLYASLGAVFADGLNVRDVYLADNGVVSLNLPINAQLVGTKASRSTHPKFLRLFNDFIRIILPRGVQVANPLWHHTRPETLDILKQAGAERLVEETNSCSRARNRSTMQPHCGVCSQCIDRRFATLAAGLEEFDPSGGYEIDVLHGAIPEGTARTMAVSYVRFAREVARLPEQDFFARFQELDQCIPPDGPEQEEVATALVEMLKRHAASVLRVLEDDLTIRPAQVIRHELPESCLLRMSVAPDAMVVADGFRHSSDFRSITFQHEEYTLTPRQAQIVEILYEARSQETPEIGQDTILVRIDAPVGTRLRDLFRDSPLWQTLVVRGKRKGTVRLNF
jgi:7-cyano-7-deazaguanine synthase in queuosine biosynthesis